MPLFITITLTTVGNDPGPYNIFYIDGFSNVTSGPTNVSQSALLSGYNVVVPSGTLTIRVQSVNTLCQQYYLDLDIPCGDCLSVSLLSTDLPASWSALTCDSEFINGTFTEIGESVNITKCICLNTLYLNNAEIKESSACTTTTTIAPTTSTTTTVN